MNNAIRCPKCKEQLREANATFKPVAGTSEFDMRCLLCGHEWRAHHRDFYDPERNPFQPINITPKF
jgi:hypothetical protein